MIFTKIIFGVLLAVCTSVGSATPTGDTNTPALLEPRAPPAVHNCARMPWIRRECNRSNHNVRAWWDVCNAGILGEFNIPGAGCPSSPPTMCANIVEPDGTRTIECQPILTPGMLLARKRKRDPEAGSSPKKLARVSPQNTEINHPVTVADDMTASVSGVVFGEFLIYINIAIGADGDMMWR